MPETLLTDPPPPLNPGEKYVQIETDTFCVECGYNLHSQPVTRDERLGIFICRCPECGKFHPAGTAITAAKPWLSRFAALLLVFWVLFVLHALFWVCMGLGASQYGFIETMTYRKWISADGAEVEYSMLTVAGRQQAMPVRKGTTQPVNITRMVYTLERPTSQHQPWSRVHRPWWAAPVMALLGGGVALVSGGLLVTFLWHWPRRRYKWAMLLPFAVGGFMIAAYVLDEDFDLIRRWAIGVTILLASIQAVFLLVGTFIGRPIARTLLRLFVPPQPRQHFNFLWQVDGKTPTPAKVAQSS